MWMRGAFVGHRVTARSACVHFANQADGGCVVCATRDICFLLFWYLLMRLSLAGAISRFLLSLWSASLWNMPVWWLFPADLP